MERECVRVVQGPGDCKINARVGCCAECDGPVVRAAVPCVSRHDTRPPHPRSQCCLEEGPLALQNKRPFLRRAEKAFSPLNIDIGGTGGEALCG